MTTPIGPGSTAAVLTASATTPPDSHLGVAEGNDEMMAVLPAVPSSLPQTRHLVAQWLADAGWPTIAAEDFVLAVNEATANVVDHAYPDDAPGNVHLHGWIAPSPTAGRVVVQRPGTGLAAERDGPYGHGCRSRSRTVVS